jgi:hypothetical protein
MMPVSGIGDTVGTNCKTNATPSTATSTRIRPGPSSVEHEYWWPGILIDGLPLGLDMRTYQNSMRCLLHLETNVLGTNMEVYAFDHQFDSYI